VSIIGPNGAGKTTVFNLITGIYKPDSGDLLLGGASLVGLTPQAITDRWRPYRMWATVLLRVGWDRKGGGRRSYRRDHGAKLRKGT